MMLVLCCVVFFLITRQVTAARRSWMHSASGRFACCVICRLLRRMGADNGIQSSLFDLDADHLADGLEQLDAVVKEAQLFLVPSTGAFAVVPFHGFMHLNSLISCWTFTLRANLFSRLSFPVAKIGGRRANRPCESCQQSCEIGQSAYCASCTIGHLALVYE